MISLTATLWWTVFATCVLDCHIIGGHTSNWLITNSQSTPGPTPLSWTDDYFQMGSFSPVHDSCFTLQFSELPFPVDSATGAGISWGDKVLQITLPYSTTEMNNIQWQMVISLWPDVSESRYCQDEEMLTQTLAISLFLCQKKIALHNLVGL